MGRFKEKEVKNMIYRSAKLLELAKEAPCQCCGMQDGTVVAAHSNQQRDGKGTGIKAHDYRIAYLCHRCHSYVDGDPKATREQKKELWEEAHRKTIGWLFSEGHLKVM
jgi:hypothetical protein